MEGGCCGVKWKEGVGGVEGGDRVGWREEVARPSKVARWCSSRMFIQEMNSNQ